MPAPSSHPPYLSAPAGLFWHRLSEAHSADLRHFWHLMSRHGGQTRLWQGWSGTLVDCSSGRFAAAYLQLFGLYAGPELVALAAEAESPENRAASEITFAVAPAWQGRRIGHEALSAALSLAKHRGSDLAHLEFHPDNQACRALCQSRGLRPLPHGNTLRVAIPLRWWQRCRQLWQNLCRR